MVTVPSSPADLGLPFEAWRPNQHDALSRLTRSLETSILLEAPTASGKSVIGVSTPFLHRARAVVLTQTLGLQAQYVETYPWLASVSGRDNFASDEEYVDQRDRGMTSQVMVTNYAWFLRSANRGVQPNNIGWLILDEGHLVEDALGNFLTLTMDISNCHVLGLDLPERAEGFQLELYARNMLPRVREALAHCQTSNQRDPRVATIVEDLRDLEWTLWLITQHTVGWVATRSDKALTLQPTRPGRLAQQLLFRHAQRHLLMSATFLDLDEVAYSLDLRSWESITVPPTIPASRRPVIYQPTASTRSHDTGPDPHSLSLLVAQVDRIIEHHAGKRGVIHTTTYPIATYIRQHSRFGKLLIAHDDAAGRADALGRFLATPGAILVSPSMDLGVDLPNDSARWQVIAKIPFPNLNDPAVRERKRVDPRWYPRKTLSRLLQACGRIVRAEDDHGVTYILDADLTVLQSHFHLLPGWFREAIQGV